jgi:hypothetical protein
VLTGARSLIQILRCAQKRRSLKDDTKFKDPEDETSQLNRLEFTTGDGRRCNNVSADLASSWKLVADSYGAQAQAAVSALPWFELRAAN